MRPEKPRKSRLGRLTHCTGRRNGQRGGVVVDLDGLEVAEQRRPVVPVHVRARARRRCRRCSADSGMNVTSVRPMLVGERRGSSASIWSNTSGDQSTRSILLTATTTRADAEQRHEEAVPAGLGEHALAGVDEDHGDVGGRRAGDHVAGVLLVAGGVGDDELAALGGEVAVGDVDRDALLTLGRRGRRAAGRSRGRRPGCRPWPSRPRGRRGGPRTRGGTRRAGGRSACSCRRRRCRR